MRSLAAKITPHTTATTTLMRAICWLTRHIKPVELVQLKPAKGPEMLISREDALKALNDRIGQVNRGWVVLHAIIEVKYLGKHVYGNQTPVTSNQMNRNEHILQVAWVALCSTTPQELINTMIFLGLD